MIKKIVISLIAIAAVAVGVVGMSAFEAHVINVTAKIENALSVPIDDIDFGTVFPQEQLDFPFDISLSDSFLAEDRVDDVEYMIRQKPKCGWTLDNGTNLLGLPTATGHVTPILETEDPTDYEIICPDPLSLWDKNGDQRLDFLLPNGAEFGVLPSLCEYLSKHKVEIDERQKEVQVDAFHQPFSVDNNEVTYTEAMGYLSKIQEDTTDGWNIDLKVPCFGDHCAQDWATFVTDINESANPDDYIQPIENEHKVFGCDLWVEVTGVSETDDHTDLCTNADVMLTLDESSSIGSEDLDSLKTAANAFVTALLDGVHIGEVSFATGADLDVHLTDVLSDLTTAIGNLGSGGNTNLEAGILESQWELGGGDAHDRPDVTSPDYMVIITDGVPTACVDEDTDPGCDNGTSYADAAKNAAIAAKAAGTKIYVVGVDVSTSNATYLEDDISSGPGYYFSIDDYSQLEALLSNLAQCDQTT